jgi:MOSC domain-containing protein YiiM
MKILTIHAGVPRTVSHRGREIRTAIFKEPVLFPVVARRLGLEGDAQADLRVHGGPDKAVYAYDAAGYSHFSEELGREIPFGRFGENLTVEGMPETDVRIGDVYRAGAALVQVASPRSPCYKLAMRMEMPTFPRLFFESGRTGFYLRVLEEGMLAPGDPIALVSREPGAPTVLDVVREWRRA